MYSRDIKKGRFGAALSPAGSNPATQTTFATQQASYYRKKQAPFDGLQGRERRLFKH